MATQKIDPKVIFASNAPAIDKPPVFSDKTKGWDVSRANNGRPRIKEMNKIQQDTDLKILWLNENSVTPHDASIDYPNGAVTIKDGTFKQLVSGAWVEFLDDFADKDKVKRGIANRYDPSLTYNSGERVVLTNGDIVKSTVNGNTANPDIDMTGWVKDNRVLKSVVDLPNIAPNGYIYETISYHDGNKKGGAVYKYNTSRSSVNDGGHCINGWELQGFDGVFSAVHYGAWADFEHNDDEALRKLSTAVRANNGGHIVLDGNFLVGNQTKGTSPLYSSVSTIDLYDIGDISIDFKNAKFKTQEGFKYGAFDPTTLNPYASTAPFTNATYRAMLGHMIEIKRCGTVKFEGLCELDGNKDNLIVGGVWGDRGIQNGHYGIFVAKNKNFVNDALITTKNFMNDGIYIGSWTTSNGNPNGSTNVKGEYVLKTTVRNLISEDNARQGLSLTGSLSTLIDNCTFRRIGAYKNAFDQNLQNYPAQGIDIESETGDVVETTISNSIFEDCMGGGLCNTAQGVYPRTTNKLTVNTTRLVGTTAHPMYNYNGTYNSCDFVGTVAIGASPSNYASLNDYERAVFNGGTISNRSSDGIGGITFGRSAYRYAVEPIGDLTKNGIVEFNGVRFLLTGAILTLSNGTGEGWVFDDCDFYITGYEPSAPFFARFGLATLRNCRFHDLRADATLNLEIEGWGVWDNVVLNVKKMRIQGTNYTNTIVTRNSNKSGDYQKLSLVKNDVTQYIDSNNLLSLAARTSAKVGDFYAVGDTLINSSPTSTSWIERKCITAGYFSSTAWSVSTAVTLNSYIYSGSNVYRVASVGTTGADAPTHISGTTTNGTASLEYVGSLAIFRDVGTKGASVANATGTDDTSTKLNALISSLRTAGVIQ